MVENVPTILVFCADPNGGISLKNRKNFHLFYGTQSSNIQDLKIQIYFGIFFIYSWKGILCLNIFFTVYSPKILIFKEKNLKLQTRLQTCLETGLQNKLQNGLFLFKIQLGTPQNIANEQLKH